MERLHLELNRVLVYQETDEINRTTTSSSSEEIRSFLPLSTREDADRNRCDCYRAYNYFRHGDKDAILKGRLAPPSLNRRAPALIEPYKSTRSGRHRMSLPSHHLWLHATFWVRIQQVMYSSFRRCTPSLPSKFSQSRLSAVDLTAAVPKRQTETTAFGMISWPLHRPDQCQTRRQPSARRKPP